MGGGGGLEQGGNRMCVFLKDHFSRSVKNGLELYEPGYRGEGDD